MASEARDGPSAGTGATMSDTLPRGMYRIGKHAYGACEDCGRFIRVTGWFGGWHLCLTEAERIAKRGSGNPAPKEHADAPRRSEAP